jgi:hypothetical protein
MPVKMGDFRDFLRAWMFGRPLQIGHPSVLPCIHPQGLQGRKVEAIPQLDLQLVKAKAEAGGYVVSQFEISNGTSVHQDGQLFHPTP